jgi:hypothetical protein
MARMESAVAGRGLALAISLLLLGVATGEVGHAIAGLEGHRLGPVVLATDAPSAAPDSAAPHNATVCLLCRAGRVSTLILKPGAARAQAVAGPCGRISLPETLTPCAPRHRSEVARAPPARLVA